MDPDEPVRVAYWYFGGLACTAAASCTHPLDLIKVRMQTSANLLPTSVVPSKEGTPAASIGAQSTSSLAGSQVRLERPAGMFGTFRRVLSNEGVAALYAGLTACWLKQMTYSTARFGIYGFLKGVWPSESAGTLWAQAICSGAAGAAGGLIGVPADLVNIRMQNDTKLPVEQRRK
jgi:dicarboxylate transporter 10